MKALLRGLVLVVSVLTVTVAGAPEAAQETFTYEFYDCTGPAGTPTTFTAVKTATPEESGHLVSAAAAFRLTDGSATYTVFSFGEGNFSPPGIGRSKSVTVVCTVDFDDVPTEVAGRLSPAD